MTVHWPDIVDGTWPAARVDQVGPFQLREGRGGGSRVSAANALAPATPADIDAAESAMQAMGQKRIFCLWPGDEALDNQLQDRGYQVLDPVNIYSCPVDHLTDQPLPPVTVFTTWEPLSIMREIWASAGIGPRRLAVMDRAKGPKTGLLMRHDDQPAGTGFVAIHASIAVVHALEILPAHQRQGLGGWAMRGAAFWARDNGARTPQRDLHQGECGGQWTLSRARDGGCRRIPLPSACPRRKPAVTDQSLPTALNLPMADPLPPETQKYFEICVEKLGFVPNVLRAYAFDIDKLNAFTAMYNDLMLG